MPTTKVGRATLQSIKVLLSLAVVAAVLGGAYWAFDRYLLPHFRNTTAQEQVVETTLTTVAAITTDTTAPPRSDRVISENSRYGTAIALSKAGYPNGATGVVLVPGEEYLNSLSVAPLAAAYGGPVLLVPPDGIDSTLSAEIKRLNPSQIFLVGVARSSRAKRTLADAVPDAEVTSLTGGDAYETATLVAAQVKAKLGKVTAVVVVPSNSYIEALAVGPLAGAMGWPILLASPEGKLSSATRNAIEELGPTSALEVGTNAELPLTDVNKQVGADPYESAALVVRYAVTLGMSYAHTAIATGQAFPDGLIAGPFLAKDKGVLLLAKDNKLPEPFLALYSANADAMSTLDFIAVKDLAKAMGSVAVDTTTTTTAAGETSTTDTTEAGAN